MSDKKIHIQIAATGGDQAAAEAKKVVPAVEAAVGSVAHLEKEMVEATKAFKSAVIGSDEFAAASKRLETAKANLNEATKKVTVSSLSMKGSMQNVGYQVQDLAVQIGAGTSAFTALGQQAPQLLSGFGPVGVMLGTLSAIALPLAGHFFKLGDATKEAGEKAGSSVDKLEKLREKAAEVAAAKSATKLRAWLDSLDDEEQAILNQNAALQRNIELMRMKRKDAAETADLERELEITNIETDPNKSEEQKIIEVARVRKRSTTAAAEQKKKDLADQADSAALKSIADWETTLREEDDIAKTKARKKELEAEKARLKGKVVKADGAALAMAGIDDKLRSLDAEESASMLSPETGEMNPFIKDGFSKRREALKKARAEQEAITNTVDQKVRARLKNPKEGGGDVETEITEADQEIKKKTRALEEKRLAAAESAAKAAEAKAIRDERSQEIDRRLEVSTRIDDARATAALREAQKRTADKAKQEAAKKEKQDLEDQLERSGKALDSQARGYGQQATAAGLKDGNKVLAQIGRDLSDGTNAAELQKIGDLMSEKFSELGEHNVSALKGVLEKLRDHADKMQVMQEQIRNIGRRSR